MEEEERGACSNCLNNGFFSSPGSERNGTGENGEQQTVSLFTVWMANDLVPQEASCMERKKVCFPIM